jgi:hypothetical protein
LVYAINTKSKAGGSEADESMGKAVFACSVERHVYYLESFVQEEGDHSIS